MLSHRAAYSIMMILIGIYILQCYVYYPILPEYVATHFNFSGLADRWSPKIYLIFSLGSVMLLIILLIPGITILIQKFPKNINVPNKEFWLAPDRRELTMNIIDSYLLSIGNTTLALIVGSAQMIFQANMNKTVNMGSSFLFLVLGFIIVTLTLVGIMIKKFSKIK